MLQEHLAAAVYLEDEAVFLDATVWAARLGEQRGFPRWAVVAGLGALEASLPSDLPCTRDYVAAAVATLEP